MRNQTVEPKKREPPMRYFLVPTIAVSIATFASVSVSNAQQQRYYNNGKYVGSSQTRSNQSGTTTQYRGTSGQNYGSTQTRQTPYGSNTNVYNGTGQRQMQIQRR